MRTLRPVLVLEVARGLLGRDRFGLVDRALAALDHRVRQAEVLAEAVRDVVRASHGVDRAVAAGDRAERGLARPEPQLVAPVDAFPVRSVRALEAELAADVGDVLVGEVADELAQRVGRPRRVRVGEGDDVARALGHRTVQRGELAAARQREQADARIVGGTLLHDLVRAVGRAVGDDEDLELLGRVVEREQVLEPRRDHVLLVVRGDDHRDARRDVRLAHGARPDAREQRRRERIAHVRPDDAGEARPEQHPHDDHRRKLAESERSRRSPPSSTSGGEPTA